VASATYVTLNSAGIRAILTSGAVQGDLNRRASAVARAAGPGFEMRATPRSRRGRAEAVAVSYEARRSANKYGALVAAIGAAR